MKILITTDCYTPTINGVVTSILNFETELRRLGHEVKILCPSENFHCCEIENVYRVGSVGVGRIYNGARAAFRISHSNLQRLIDWCSDINSFTVGIHLIYYGKKNCIRGELPDRSYIPYSL